MSPKLSNISTYCQSLASKASASIARRPLYRSNAQVTGCLSGTANPAAATSADISAATFANTLKNTGTPWKSIPKATFASQSPTREASSPFRGYRKQQGASASVFSRSQTSRSNTGNRSPFLATWLSAVRQETQGMESLIGRVEATQERFHRDVRPLEVPPCELMFVDHVPPRSKKDGQPAVERIKHESRLQQINLVDARSESRH